MGNNLVQELTIVELEQRIEFSCCGGDGTGGTGGGGGGGGLPECGTVDGGQPCTQK